MNFDRKNTDHYITRRCRQVFAEHGLADAEVGSPIHDLMIAWDDSPGTTIKDWLVRTARKIDQITPFAKVAVSLT